MLVQRTSQTWKHLVHVLQPGEEAALYISIAFNFDELTENDFIEKADDCPYKFLPKPEIMEKYKEYKMIVNVAYKDMYQNQFNQKLVLSVNPYISCAVEKKEAKYSCDLNLIEAMPPEKVIKS